ncbi:hypothetical protein [Streptomyces sp. Y7]|uniref:hypothetical protein n=1 Tax=Streptomyces sp. Y7 TaxID=3342392 RepID=UPI003721B6E2
MVAVNVRPDIDAAAAKLSSAFGAKREIQKLPEVLWEGETVEMLATGVYGKTERHPNSPRTSPCSSNPRCRRPGC